jgi:hypothetical protein
MGDRANVYIHEGDTPGVYLYAHWSGSDLPGDVKTALSYRERWDDMPYLTRIVFSTMTGNVFSTTGYGIDTRIGDGADRIVDIDVSAQTVHVKGFNGDTKPVSFTEYIST